MKKSCVFFLNLYARGDDENKVNAKKMFKKKIHKENR